MKLKTLLKDIPVKEVKGSKEIEISGLCAHSKCVAPGYLFIAKRGFIDDGQRYLTEAVDGGAVAIVTDIYNPFLPKTVQILHSCPAEIEGALAANFYGHPSEQLFLVGVTGTNGKTTCSSLVRHILEGMLEPCGLIGTIEYLVGKQRYTPTHTTPDAITNQKLLREMLSQGCTAAAMEVSSHALEQGRVDALAFDCALFTNLTQDHLDYHHTFANYARAKSKLFTALWKTQKTKYPPIAIVNKDDPWHEEMIASCPVSVLTYGMQAGCDVQAVPLHFSAEGTRFEVCFRGQKAIFEWSLIGRFNIYNAMAAISVGLHRGWSLEDMVPLVNSFSPVLGRLERVPNAMDLAVYVDYAHTDDALKNVLETLTELKKGRLITVFGCGGMRDRGKRPKMAAVVEQYADVAIVTTDNPREESPEAIYREIIQGFSDTYEYLYEEDRKKAIALAIEQARPEDIVLVAGKGHETYQIFAHTTVTFDDRIAVQEACAARMEAMSL